MLSRCVSPTEKTTIKQLTWDNPPCAGLRKRYVGRIVACFKNAIGSSFPICDPNPLCPQDFSISGQKHLAKMQTTSSLILSFSLHLCLRTHSYCSDSLYVIPQNIIHVKNRGFVVTCRSYEDSGSCCVLVHSFANR